MGHLREGGGGAGGGSGGGGFCEAEALPEGLLNSGRLTLKSRSLFIPLGHGTVLSSTFLEAELPAVQDTSSRSALWALRWLLSPSPAPSEGEPSPCPAPAEGEPSPAPAEGEPAAAQRQQDGTQVTMCSHAGISHSQPGHVSGVTLPFVDEKWRPREVTGWSRVTLPWPQWDPAVWSPAGTKLGDCV